MAQYALPNADIANNGWTQCQGDGDADHFDELSEGFGAGRGSGSGPDSATTSWLSANGPANDEIRTALSSVTDPVSSTGHLIRTRNRKANISNCSAGDNAGIQLDITIKLYQDTTEKATETFTNVNGTYTTRTHTLTAGEADSITDYSLLRIGTIANKVGGGQNRVGTESAHEFECPDAPAGGGLTVTASDNINNYSDAVDKILNYLISDKSDTINNFSDAIEKILSYLISDKADDSNNYADASQVALGLLQTAADDANNYGDAFVVVLGLNELLSDDINNFSDEIKLLLNYLINLSDDINNFSDETLIILTYLITFTDDVNNFADLVEIAIVLSVAVSDNINNFLDDKNFTLGLVQALEDDINNFSDDIKLLFNYLVQPGETLDFTDLVEFNFPLTLEFFDSYSLSDSMILQFYMIFPPWKDKQFIMRIGMGPVD